MAGDTVIPSSLLTKTTMWSLLEKGIMYSVNA